MRRVLEKYKGFPRRIKLFYLLNNLVNIKYLRRNKEIYLERGFSKAVWGAVRHSKLANLSNRRPVQKEAPVKPEILTEDMIRSWNDDGVLILRGFFKDFVTPLNNEINFLQKSGKVGFNFTKNKILFANRVSSLIRSIEKDQVLNDILSYLLGLGAMPFQTINFMQGSEQKAHSDSIHMSTFPEGCLIAAWVAMDQVEDDNGPVFYYPGSHRWPYLYNEDIGLNENWLLLDQNPNGRYEEALERQIKSRDVRPVVFTANPGDVLIWHANLVHGGSPHLNKNKMRRSMVMHYFGKGVICYHELTQRPAIFK